MNPVHIMISVEIYDIIRLIKKLFAILIIYLFESQRSVYSVVVWITVVYITRIKKNIENAFNKNLISVPLKL